MTYARYFDESCIVSTTTLLTLGSYSRLKLQGLSSCPANLHKYLTWEENPLTCLKISLVSKKIPLVSNRNYRLFSGGQSFPTGFMQFYLPLTRIIVLLTSATRQTRNDEPTQAYVRGKSYDTCVFSLFPMYNKNTTILFQCILILCTKLQFDPNTTNLSDICTLVLRSTGLTRKRAVW